MESSDRGSSFALDAFSLRGDVALVTGGGTGIGLAIASAFVSAGARVVITGRRENILRDAASSLGPSASYVVHDVTRAQESSFREMEEMFGPITILVNNAGVHLKKPATETTDDEFRQVYDTHVTGALAMSRAFLPKMLERGRGNILFIASMASLFGIPQVIAYAAAKSAYLGMMRTLACEVGPKGVRVNAIAPGWIETPMLNKALDGDPVRKEKILSRTPMARFGDPADIGFAAIYLCSRAGAFINGVVLPVDGGASIGF